MTPTNRPAYRLTYAPSALRELEKLDRGVSRRVLSDIEKLRDNPRPRGVAKMETNEELYRIHIGPGKKYRAIYAIQDDVLLVLIVRVGHRKEVYRRI